MAKTDAVRKIVIIERNDFLRDCLYRSIAKLWPADCAAYASLPEFARVEADPGLIMVALSIISLSEQEADAEFALLVNLDPSLRSMVLAKVDNLNEALAALSRGANGYISMSAGFEIFVQAMQFVAAGGTYVPPQCLLAAKPAATIEQASEEGVTSREIAVIQAIRQGKPNKVIAYELNMCESTVKVHVRHIMKKLRARNRTDVAIKSSGLAMISAHGGSRSPPTVLDGATRNAPQVGSLRPIAMGYLSETQRIAPSWKPNG